MSGALVVLITRLEIIPDLYNVQVVALDLRAAKQALGTKLCSAR